MFKLACVFSAIGILNVVALSVSERVFYEVVEAKFEYDQTNEFRFPRAFDDVILPALEAGRENDRIRTRSIWWATFKFQLVLAVLLGWGFAIKYTRKRPAPRRIYEPAGTIFDWLQRDGTGLAILVVSVFTHVAIACAILLPLSFFSLSQSAFTLARIIITGFATLPGLFFTLHLAETDLIEELAKPYFDRHRY